jgi:hypothetical protein
MPEKAKTDRIPEHLVNILMHRGLADGQEGHCVACAWPSAQVGSMPEKAKTDRIPEHLVNILMGMADGQEGHCVACAWPSATVGGCA